MHTESTDSPPMPLPGISIYEPKQSQLKWLLLLVPIGYFWFRLIDNLRLEWSTNPQYSYGLVVPLLIIGLLIRSWHRASATSSPEEPGRLELGLGLFAFLAFLYLPTRLLEAATPEWRPIQWVLGVETIGLTLTAIYLTKGKGWLRLAAFPVCFFFVAIPWPTLIEAPIIQGLTRLNAALVVEVLGIVDVPAIQHGNVIEVSTGMVGINDACSGIRSLQSSLMISLFFGEFYRLRWPSRFLFVGLGFVLAMVFNLFRASLLAWIASQKGLAAIAEYHDEAGFTILVACTLTLWGLGYFLSRRKSLTQPAQMTDAVGPGNPGNAGQRGPVLKRVAFGLIIWLVLVELGVESWYRVRESQIKLGPAWTVNLPVGNASFTPVPVTENEHTLLRFDDVKQGQWQESDGTTWQVYYFDWHPGRVAGYLAKRHTPDICLPATGLTMLSGPTLTGINIQNVYLPMRSYVFGGPDRKLQVFQCHWEPGMKSDYAHESSRFNLIRGIWAGRGNQGQKVLEVIITGYDDTDQARQALVRQLGKWIQVEK